MKKLKVTKEDFKKINISKMVEGSVVTCGDISLGSGDNLNLTASTDLFFGSTSLGETTAANDSGAYVVGAFDEFDYSTETNVQGVLDDLDAKIGDIIGGTVGMWTDG